MAIKEDIVAVRDQSFHGVQRNIPFSGLPEDGNRQPRGIPRSPQLSHSLLVVSRGRPARLSDFTSR